MVNSQTSQLAEMFDLKLQYIGLTAGYGQNGDKPKRLQVQSKRMNLLS